MKKKQPFNGNPLKKRDAAEELREMVRIINSNSFLVAELIPVRGREEAPDYVDDRYPEESYKLAKE